MGTLSPRVGHLKCIDGGFGTCSGRVEYRTPLSGSGESFVRCEFHWEGRLEREHGLAGRYPEYVVPHRMVGDSGEIWDEEY